MPFRCCGTAILHGFATPVNQTVNKRYILTYIIPPLLFGVRSCLSVMLVDADLIEHGRIVSPNGRSDCSKWPYWEDKRHEKNLLMKYSTPLALLAPLMTFSEGKNAVMPRSWICSHFCIDSPSAFSKRTRQRSAGKLGKVFHFSKGGAASLFHTTERKQPHVKTFQALSWTMTSLTQKLNNLKQPFSSMLLWRRTNQRQT